MLLIFACGKQAWSADLRGEAVLSAAISCWMKTKVSSSEMLLDTFWGNLTTSIRLDYWTLIPRLMLCEGPLPESVTVSVMTMLPG